MLLVVAVAKQVRDVTKNWPNLHLQSLTTDSDDGVIEEVVRVIAEHYPCDSAIAAELARCFAASGTCVSSLRNQRADVASTGGPTSLSTLVAPLFLRALGAVVPKLGIHGRPAGGVDSLAQIPGYRIEFSIGEIERILETHGYAHFVGGGTFTPLDSKVFAVRQRVGAQSIPTLAAASLLSKKLALGVKHAGLDVRVAKHGNFGTDWESASKNAALFLQTSRALGILASPVLTDARFPYQPYIGRRESLVALDDIFSGKADAQLQNHLRLCQVLAQTCIGEGLCEGKVDIASVFFNNLEAQGASAEAFSDLVQETREAHVHLIRARRPGFAYWPLEQLRRMLTHWQESLKAADGATFSDPVGLRLVATSGMWVRGLEVLATARAPAAKANEIVDALEEACLPTLLPQGAGFEGIHG
jgi:hypothetical protein